MEKAEEVIILRRLTVISCLIICCIAKDCLSDNPLGALLMSPITLLSGVCALKYYRLDKKGKDKVYKFSFLHLYTIAMHPYYLFAGTLFLNALIIFGLI